MSRSGRGGGDFDKNQRPKLHLEKFLQSTLKFPGEGADNSFNRGKSPVTSGPQQQIFKELQAEVLDWAAAAAHPERFQVTVAATF